MKILRRILGLRIPSEPPPLPDKVASFIRGDICTLTSADIDPEGTAKYQSYERAMELKKAGRLDEAAAILEGSCQPPSIFCGHYRELFQIYRIRNKEDLVSCNFSPVRDRVLTMIRFDDEMIDVMTHHYSERQGRKLPQSTFVGSRNLKISDARSLLKAATGLEDKILIRKANKYIKSFKEQKKRG